MSFNSASESGIEDVRGASFDKKEFKTNVVGSVAYAPLFTVELHIVTEEFFSPVCFQIGLNMVELDYWKPKLQVLGSQKFWRRPNLHIGMHTSCERRSQQEGRREVQLVTSFDNAIK